MIGWAFRQLAIWGGVALVLFIIAHRLPAPPGAPGPAPTAATPPPEAARGAVPNSLVFHADPRGHVVLDASVNGAPVKFLVDTGATTVTLTLRDAAAAGLTPSDLVFSQRTMTANGVGRVAPVRLRELRIDQLTVDDVAAVVDEHLFMSLLGQSFLTRLDGYEMKNGVLTLTYW